MPTGYEVSSKYFDDAAKAGMPSQASYDTAAARIRSRIEGKQRANEQAIGDQFTGRTPYGSGYYDQAQRQNREQATSAYSSGLADLESEYEKAKQTGAGILTNIGSAAGNITNTGNYNTGSLLGQYPGTYSFLAQNDPKFMDWLNGASGTNFNLPSPDAFQAFASSGTVNPASGNAPPGSTPVTPVGSGATGGGTGTGVTPGGSMSPNPTPAAPSYNAADYPPAAQSILSVPNRVVRTTDGRLYDTVVKAYVVSNADLGNPRPKMVIGGVTYYGGDFGGGTPGADTGVLV